ncbi:hypothetical protein BD779DRAFT_1454814, partial [Infundibulicybe gibba]
SAIRPKEYDEKILWAFDDCKGVPGLLTDSNKARPPMDQGTARMIVTRDLDTLPRAPPPVERDAKKTKTYYKNNFPKQWYAAISTLERLEPNVALCAAHWKAEHVLSNTLNAMVQKQDRKATNARKTSSSEESDWRRWQSSQRGQGDIEEAYHQETPPQPPTTHELSTAKKKTSSHRFSYVNNHLGELERDFKDIPYASDLLNAMMLHPDFESGQPSDDVAALLTRIENADPNSSEYSEDETGANWGHHQFTAGGLTCHSALLSWRSVGNVEMACRLIAAAIKTYRVARHICFKRGTTEGSYLSRAYLQNLVERLWEIWKDAGGVSGHLPKTSH